ncbi:MAG: hypothetical protein HQL14_08675 [Candidatus Omnitrophica bacterium]|nr:hypothetical protein [Candidatus Omnitrophota bacterium]
MLYFRYSIFPILFLLYFLTGTAHASYTPISASAAGWTLSGSNTSIATNNVGIGSLSPSQALDVAGTVRMQSFVMTQSPSSGYVLTSDASGNGIWAPGGGGGNGWTEVLTNVTTTGTNVGIGTTAPIASL